MQVARCVEIRHSAGQSMQCMIMNAAGASTAPTHCHLPHPRPASRSTHSAASPGGLARTAAKGVGSKL